MEPIRIMATIIGLIVVLSSFFWAARILMVKSTDPPRLARLLFRACRNALHLMGRLIRDPDRRRQLWALYIPISLVAILVWALIWSTFGYTLFIFGVTGKHLRDAYLISISSISTLGIAPPSTSLLVTTISGIEAFTVPIFVSLLVAYSISIYSQYSSHIETIRALDAELGNAEGPLELLVTTVTTSGVDALDRLFQNWTSQFLQIDAIHGTVDGYLLLYAPNMTEHWGRDAPAVIDSAAVWLSIIPEPQTDAAAACFEAGTRAVDHLAEHYRHRVIALGQRTAVAHMTRGEFDWCVERLRDAGLPVVTDRDAAWDALQQRRQSYERQVDELRHMLPVDLRAGRSGQRDRR